MTNIIKHNQTLWFTLLFKTGVLWDYTLCQGLQKEWTFHRQFESWSPCCTSKSLLHNFQFLLVVVQNIFLLVVQNNSFFTGCCSEQFFTGCSEQFFFYWSLFRTFFFFRKRRLTLHFHCSVSSSTAFLQTRGTGEQTGDTSQFPRLTYKWVWKSLNQGPWRGDITNMSTRSMHGGRSWAKARKGLCQNFWSQTKF